MDDRIELESELPPVPDVASRQTPGLDTAQQQVRPNLQTGERTEDSRDTADLSAARGLLMLGAEGAEVSSGVDERRLSDARDPDSIRRQFRAGEYGLETGPIQAPGLRPMQGCQAYRQRPLQRLGMNLSQAPHLHTMQQFRPRPPLPMLHQQRSMQRKPALYRPIWQQFRPRLALQIPHQQQPMRRGPNLYPPNRQQFVPPLPWQIWHQQQQMRHGPDLYRSIRQQFLPRLPLQIPHQQQQMRHGPVSYRPTPPTPHFTESVQSQQAQQGPDPDIQGVSLIDTIDPLHFQLGPDDPDRLRFRPILPRPTGVPPAVAHPRKRRLPEKEEGEEEGEEEEEEEEDSLRHAPSRTRFWLRACKICGLRSQRDLDLDVRAHRSCLRVEAGMSRRSQVRQRVDSTFRQERDSPETFASQRESVVHDSTYEETRRERNGPEAAGQRESSEVPRSQVSDELESPATTPSGLALPPNDVVDERSPTPVESG